MCFETRGVSDAAHFNHGVDSGTTGVIECWMVMYAYSRLQCELFTAIFSYIGYNQGSLQASPHFCRRRHLVFSCELHKLGHKRSPSSSFNFLFLHCSSLSSKYFLLQICCISPDCPWWRCLGSLYSPWARRRWRLANSAMGRRGGGMCLVPTAQGANDPNCCSGCFMDSLGRQQAFGCHRC